MSTKDRKCGFLKKIPLDTEVLCLLGFSWPCIEEEMASWLFTEGRSVIFFHKEPFIESSSCEISSKIQFVFCEKPECDFSLLKEIFLEKVFLNVHYEIDSSLEKEEKEWLEEVVSHSILLEWHTYLEASDAQDFGVKVFKNITTNYCKGAPLKQFYALKDVLKGMPAFICGAGPSLKESIPYLMEHKEKGFVFAGGAALGLLSEFQIQVHIAAGVDPDPSHEKSKMQGSFEAPFFYQARFSSDLLDLVQGPLFQVPSESSLPLEKLLEEAFPFDGGPTVTTFCAALAIHLGCSPLIFIGMDLSYLEKHTKYVESKESQNLSWNGVVYEEKLTQKDWVIAAKWLESLARDFEIRRFYTLSQKGLSLEGIYPTSWSCLLEKELLRCYDIEGFLQGIRSLGMEDKRFLDDRVIKIKESMHRSLQIVDRLIALFQESYPEDPSSKGVFVLELFTLYEEIVYLNVLEPLWKVWQFPLGKCFQDPYAKQLNQWLFFKKVLQEHLLSGDLCK